MIAALATLVFLATLWMLVVLGAAMLEKSGARILAALRREYAEPMLRTRPVRLRPRRFDPRRPMRISLQRAAA
jgi:hypothetical protein